MCVCAYGSAEPRHALTYDDAGGLMYFYRTNTYAYEDLDLSVTLVEPAQFLNEANAKHFATPTRRRCSNRYRVWDTNWANSSCSPVSVPAEPARWACLWRG